MYSKASKFRTLWSHAHARMQDVHIAIPAEALVFNFSPKAFVVNFPLDGFNDPYKIKIPSKLIAILYITILLSAFWSLETLH